MAGTGVGKFSSTAGNNTSNMTTNFAENMAPSNVNNAARELMGHIYDMYKQLGDGYFEFGDGDATYTVARSDADTITITSSSDISSIYFPGRKIRITDGGANVVEGTIASSSHSSTTQTVNLTGISLASGTPTKVELGIDTAAFGGRIILDDDGDTYIEAPTDDTIDIYVAGAKDFTFTANTFTAHSGSNVDLDGDLDVDGTTNLDVVDIDGAVNMASTLQVDGSITSSDGMTITTADNEPQLILTSTDADANEGPRMNFVRNSGSPANNDVLARISLQGKDAGANTTTYAELETTAVNVAEGSETGKFNIKTAIAGSINQDVITMTGSEVVINDSSNDIDFRVESNGNANRFKLDAGDDVIVMGTSTVEDSIYGAKPALQLTGTDFNTSAFSIIRNAADGNSPNLIFGKSRSSDGNTVVQNGDDLGNITFAAADGTDQNNTAARIYAEIDGAPGANDTPGRLVFATTADGSNSATERLRIDSSGVATFTSSLIATGLLNTVNNSLLLIGGGNASNVGSNLTMYGGASGSAGAFRFRNATTVTTNITANGQIECVGGAVSAPSYSFTNDTNTGMTRPTTDTLTLVTAGAERVRVDSDGDLFIGTTLVSPNPGIYLNNAGQMNIGNNNGTNGQDFIIFRRNASNIGSVIQNGTTGVSYLTSSDYRLKENVVTDWNATTRLKQLKPARFNFIADADTTVDGFLAHEVSDIVPEAINGVKDETETKEKVVLNANSNVIAEGIEEADWEIGKSDILWTSDDIETQDVLYTSDDVETQNVLYTEEDELPEGVEVGDIKEPATKSVGDVKQEATQTVGDVKTEAIYPTDSTWVASKVIPKYQGIDQSKLVPLLVKTIQELEARITALES